jgi:hypothetical protein
MSIIAICETTMSIEPSSNALESHGVTTVNDVFATALRSLAISINREDRSIPSTERGRDGSPRRRGMSQIVNSA